MSMDLAPFIEAFQAESQEGLDLMEASLLKLENGDEETIHEIFRAAHSIKGGAGTFGMNDVSDFTHSVETLLDAMRAGEHQADPETVALLLEATDCIRALLAAARGDAGPDTDKLDDVRQRVEATLGATGKDMSSAAPAPAAASNGADAPTQWTIRFVPDREMLAGGNDPLGMFAELADLGALTASADLETLPSLEQLEPEKCYLAWTLQLQTMNDQRERIEEAFEWVADECELQITAASVASAAPGTATGSDAGSNATDTGKDSDTSTNQAARSTESTSIRVNTGKIDQMINMVGELVITQSMLSQVGGEIDENVDGKWIERLREGLSQLERNTRDLQESIMAVRMVPISFVFNRLPRLVHDVCARLGKQTELNISGEHTEIDKTLIEKISDPLVHIVRNAIDHGIESPDNRRLAGKSETGQLVIDAGHKGGNVVIEIRDDGGGLNSEAILSKARQRGLVSPDANPSEGQIFELIFAPGFSTAEEVSDLSGRGVGMDVVRRNIVALGGDVEVESEPDKGTMIRIILPLTMAILDGQAIRVGKELYVIPLVSILESIQLRDADLQQRAGSTELVHWRDEYLPLIRLAHRLDSPSDRDADSRGLVVIVEAGGHRAGVVVDDLLAQQQVVIKSLEENFQRVNGFSGATILGDGSVALIIDVAGLIKLAGRDPSPGGPTRDQRRQCDTQTNRPAA